MATLDPVLRKQLEKAIVQARMIAETGAEKVLRSLAVHHHEPHGSMAPEERKLRSRLRAHGRQFGDRRDDRGGQEIRRLGREVAYEHWHRMLFARFLAENDLLIEPSNQVPVSLGDVEDLARERGLDAWALAASFAQRMLPQIFRLDDPVLQVSLPPEARQELQRLVTGLDERVFRADDALGWTYQFWQSAEKDAVNARVKSGEKISGETLPAVTQLFTEHYMVQFLLHNTLGAWHAGKVLAARPQLAQRAQSEAELREAVALPGYSFDYLRFVREGDGPWRPAAGVFEGWPRAAMGLKVLDPCCGSGHFLVAGFELLAALRGQEEGLASAEAGAAVLRDNLFGLELDARCVQIAAFALAMAAWKAAGSVVELPPLHVACCGVGPAGPEKNWLRIVDRLRLDEDRKNALRRGMAKLYALFQQAPELGALIDPRLLREEGFAAPIDKLLPLLEQALRIDGDDEDEHEQAVAAQGMAKAAAILGQTFTLVATNVPYLGRGSQGDVLKTFAEDHYPDAKADLATVFVQRAFGWLGKTGTMAVVTPQNWLFLTSYRKLREKLLKDRLWNGIAKLGEEAWWSFGIRGPRTVLLMFSGSSPTPEDRFFGIDVSTNRGERLILLDEKAALLRGERIEIASVPQPSDLGEGEDSAESVAEEGDAPRGPADGSVRLVPQAEQLSNPDAVVTLSTGGSDRLLDQHAIGLAGVLNGDSERFERTCWEQPVGPSSRWAKHQSTPAKTVHFGGCEKALLWDDGEGELRSFARVLRERLHDADRRGNQAWGRSGVAVKQMGHLPVTRYLGTKFDSNVAVVLPVADDLTPAVWCYCSSTQYVRDLRRINQNLNVTNATLVKVPFDLDHWRRVAAEQYPLGLPEPQTNDPTQWLFHGHPAGMTAVGAADSSPLAVADPSLPQHPSLLCRTPNLTDVLQVATVRLLGYRWPAELDPAMRLDAVQRAWTTRSAELVPFADQDGIVCLNPIRGEASATDRLRALLQAAFGPQWLPDTERKLLAAAAGDDGKPAESLHAWLRDGFFAAHCKLFHDRPFVWHIWDGRADGFHALVNYHKLAGPNGEGLRVLKLLTFTYLKEWIDRQRADEKANVGGAPARLAAALVLQEELEKILAGEPPYDLFIRWKSLHEQPLGWDPDINDGVRINIRPFVLAKDVKQKGAGILRAKVNVHWKKDRGKEPESLRPRNQFPWFWSCNPEIPQQGKDYVAGKAATFDGVRWNDLHYTCAAKEAARARHAGREAAGS
ncbi:MAG TPA: N-6 DNA methylase [Planctomycetota bacterium]|nr:N-6 DNA methylase [Planctomycetota bacterium]